MTPWPACLASFPHLGLSSCRPPPPGCVLLPRKASCKRKRHSGKTAHASAYLARHRRSPTKTPAGGRKANPLGERALRESMASGASRPRWEVGARALPAQRRAPLWQSQERQPLSLQAAGGTVVQRQQRRGSMACWLSRRLSRPGAFSYRCSFITFGGGQDSVIEHLLMWVLKTPLLLPEMDGFSGCPHVVGTEISVFPPLPIRARIPSWGLHLHDFLST